MSDTVELRDTCAGIALLYDRVDEYSSRLVVAMETNDLDEMEHVTALMVCCLFGRGDTDGYKLASERWNRTFGAPQSGQEGKP